MGNATYLNHAQAPTSPFAIVTYCSACLPCYPAEQRLYIVGGGRSAATLYGYENAPMGVGHELQVRKPLSRPVGRLPILPFFPKNTNGF